MKKVLLYIPIVLSLVVLGAHFLRYGSSIGVFAALLLIVIAFGLGFATVGGDLATRSVMGLGTGQRNLSSAFVVAVQNFADDGDVLAFVIVAGLIGLVVLMAGAAEIGRRRPSAPG